MMRALSAVARGLVDVLSSPLVVAGALVVTLAAALPFALIVGNQLQDALADQPPIALGSGEIDADWWSEFRAHAEGLAATFTPTVIGAAAPLDNLSAILDGTRRPVALIAPVVTAMIVWAWFWGVALTRFHAPHAHGWRDAFAAGLAHLPRFLLISITAAAVQLLLYATIHPLLFDLAFEGIAGGGMSEPAAFAIRIVFYLVFGALLATVSLVADYSRIVQVVERPSSAGTILREGMRFVRSQYLPALMVVVVTGVLYLMLVALFAATETYGGARVGGWRGIAIGQGYIIGRLVLRLTAAAAELRLFAALRP